MTRPTHRRAVLALLLSAAASPALAAALPRLQVYKTPWCGCCSGWVEHMRGQGFADIVVTELEDLAPIRARHGIPDRAAGCHTGVIAGYALEGHVPAADVKALLARRPVAAGLAVPGMPVGSPGMEQGGRGQPFDTLLVLKDGKTEVFARHGR